MADSLALVVYYYFQSKTNIYFPNSSVSGPSEFVQISIRGLDVDETDRSRFPMTIGWRQWETILSPILNDPKWSKSLGHLGGTVSLIDNGIPVLEVGPGILSGDRREAIRILKETIRQKAVEAGYGPPVGL